MLTSTLNCSFRCFITLRICQIEPKFMKLPYFQVRARDDSLGGAWRPPKFVGVQRARIVTSLYCFIAHSPEFECRNSSQIRERGVVGCRRRTELFTTSFGGVSVPRFFSVFIIFPKQCSRFFHLVEYFSCCSARRSPVLFGRGRF